MKCKRNYSIITAIFFMPVLGLFSAEIHVSINGKDTNSGALASPFRTIQRAADVATPGDIITVHAGCYRESVNPPRGGESDSKRITFQAAPGEIVEIKGSEIIKEWVNVEDDVWKAVIPNSFFGDFNPYKDLIQGDWFHPQGRNHHTGAVYVNGNWLTEAATFEDMIGKPSNGAEAFLLNIAYFQPQENGEQISASEYSEQQGVQNAPCSEGGECVGYIGKNDWIRYDGIDFGTGTERIQIRAASLTNGGTIYIHRDSPDGELLGTCLIPHTGGWQSWKTFSATIKQLSGKQTICFTFKKPAFPQWFAQVNADSTTIWAQFPGINPNQEMVEINARQTVFYPRKTGINYISVRGFVMRHAATPWAPPTAEQIGLIGTNWSKGWIIENNTISHSICCGITLGKYGDEFDNKSANSAGGYVKTIERAIQKGWNKETIGHHLVRNNTISHCEQAGIVGSLGAIFSTVTGNTIHDIHVHRAFGGCEMAGIKFHAPIDVEISNNHIYRCNRGIWLDWMSQGTRVTRNLFHDNAKVSIDWPNNWEALIDGGEQDLFLEVNHGPIMVDNNIFLSPYTLNNRSQGVAFAHNLFAGVFRNVPSDGRKTPFHKPHSTEVVTLHDHYLGDHRYHNNIFAERSDLSGFDAATLPVDLKGNVYFNGAKPSKHETDAVVKPDFNFGLKLEKRTDGWYLTLSKDPAVRDSIKRPLVTTELLGKAKVSGGAFENSDGSPFRIDIDYFGKKRNVENPTPGPFEGLGEGTLTMKVF